MAKYSILVRYWSGERAVLKFELKTDAYTVFNALNYAAVNNANGIRCLIMKTVTGDSWETEKYISY